MVGFKTERGAWQVRSTSGVYGVLMAADGSFLAIGKNVYGGFSLFGRANQSWLTIEDAINAGVVR